MSHRNLPTICRNQRLDPRRHRDSAMVPSRMGHLVTAILIPNQRKHTTQEHVEIPRTKNRRLIHHGRRTIITPLQNRIHRHEQRPDNPSHYHVIRNHRPHRTSHSINFLHTTSQHQTELEPIRINTTVADAIMPRKTSMENMAISTE